MDYPIYILLFLFLAAFIAGVVDAIAGGGRLVTIPVLLAAGIAPAAAIATNKLGGVAGTLSSTVHFIRIGEINIKRAMIMVPTTFAGALLGGIFLTRIDNGFLCYVVPILLIGFSLYFLLSPDIGALEKSSLSVPLFLLALPLPSLAFMKASLALERALSSVCH